MLIRSSSIAGQASSLAQASADRARRLALESAERLRAEGRAAAEAEAAERIAAAERRADEAERRSEERIAAHRAQCEHSMDAATAALHHALTNLAGLERQVVAAAEGEIVRLALAVASRVLAREIETDPVWMRDLLAAALADVPDRRQVAVRCAPEDAAAIRERLAATAAAVPGTERLTLEEDAALQRGSLVLTAGGTRLDASVASSWERVAATMLAAVPRPPLAMRDDGSTPEEPSP